MGKKNNVMCNYLEKPDRFADFINGSLYGGNQLVLPEQIKDCQTVYSREGKSRDILKAVCNGKKYILIGVENQDLIHYAMPVRCMEYDVLEYKRQLRQLKANYRKNLKEKKISMTRAEFLSGMKKEAKINPVTTIVFYHGKEDYDGCKTLHDMLDFDEENEKLKYLASDYRINLVTLKELSENNFQTGLRELIGFLKHSHSGSELRKYCEGNRRRIEALDEETYDTISVMIGQKELIEQKSMYIQKNGRINMCKGIMEWMENSHQEGIIQGISQGISKGIEAFILDNQEEGVSEKRILEKLQRRFGLTLEESTEYYQKYSI